MQKYIFIEKYISTIPDAKMFVFGQAKYDFFSLTLVFH